MAKLGITVSNENYIKIRGSHGHDYKRNSLLGCDSLQKLTNVSEEPLYLNSMDSCLLMSFYYGTLFDILLSVRQTRPWHSLRAKVPQICIQFLSGLSLFLCRTHLVGLYHQTTLEPPHPSKNKQNAIRSYQPSKDRNECKCPELKYMLKPGLDL